MDELEQEIKDVYLDISKKQEANNLALATCKTLLHFLNNDTSETFLEHSKKMTKIANTLHHLVPYSEVDSVTEIFIRFTTLKSSEFNSIQEARKTSQQRGELFLTKVKNCREKIAKNSNAFITDGVVLLVHSFSEAVLRTLLQAKSLNKLFTVYATDSIMYKYLKNANIKSYLISQPSIGFYMENIDLVLVGAEAVVENGGIINQIGTYPLSLCAKAMNKPFYVLVESYKFIRLYPVCQRDISNRLKFKDQLEHLNDKSDINDLKPLVDFTPPQYIDLLLTDLGILTTAAISDILVQLYL